MDLPPKRGENVSGSDKYHHTTFHAVAEISVIGQREKTKTNRPFHFYVTKHFAQF